MATPQKGEPSKIIGSVSKFAGTLVGTAVVTGKRIIGSVAPPSKGPSDKPKKKTMQARSQRKKKAVRKTEAKVPKTKKKKKKVVKRKGTGSSGKSEASEKKPTQSPAKKKKGATAKKKTTRRKTEKTGKSEESSHSEDGLISEIGAGTDVPTGKQESQLQPPIAEAEMADKKLSSANALPETNIVQKNSATGKQEPPVKIVEYSKPVKRPKRVVPINSSA